MTSDPFADSVEYEKLTQSIYQSILNSEGLGATKVFHDEDLTGRSGVAHQIDAGWQAEAAGVTQRVLIECKNYASNLTLEKVRNFYAVLHDIGNCAGVMVTKTGFQSGARKYAEFYGIKMMLLRPPTDEDWEGRVRDIHIELRVRCVAVNKPVRVDLCLQADTKEMETVLEELKDQGKLHIPDSMTARLRDKAGAIVTDELRVWLPGVLEIGDKPDGGPHTHKIPLEDLYVLVNEGSPAPLLVRVAGLVASYHVETIETDGIRIVGDEVVRGILEDLDSGDIRFIDRGA